VLSVDLIFDTADDGTTDNPRSVREKMLPFEALMLPPKDKDQREPPRARFHWGDLIVEGIVERMDLDFDLFAANGFPLRAKMGLTISQQDERSTYDPPKQGGRSNAVAPGSGGLGAGIGLGASASLGLSAGIGVGASMSAGVSVGGHVALAIGGESAAEFATRVGVDPAAWRGIAVGQVDNTLSLQAGAEVTFSTSLSASAGLGATAGAEAGVKQPLEASFGLEAGAASSAASGLSASGFALAAAGGLSAALATVDVVRSESAAASTRRAFDVPQRPAPPLPPGTPVRGLASVPTATAAAARGAASSSSPARPDRAEQARTPLGSAGPSSPTRPGAASPAPVPPRPDSRAVSFGLGVPLRPRVGGATAPPSGADPTLPSWVALPSSGGRAPSAAGPAVMPKRCGCAGRCGCRRASR
jgi:hypothetical protein